MGALNNNNNNVVILHLRTLLKVARLDFLGLIPPTLSINYFGMSKDMEKKFITTVLYKDENFL